jgi:hypothetical protein
LYIQCLTKYDGALATRLEARMTLKDRVNLLVDAVEEGEESDEEMEVEQNF